MQTLPVCLQTLTRKYQVSIQLRLTRYRTECEQRRCFQKDTKDEEQKMRETENRTKSINKKQRGEGSKEQWR